MTTTTFQDVPSGFQSVDLRSVNIKQLQTNLNRLLYLVPSEKRAEIAAIAQRTGVALTAGGSIPEDNTYREVTHATLKAVLETIYDRRPDLRGDMRAEEWIKQVGDQIVLGANSYGDKPLRLAAPYGSESPVPLSATHEVGENNVVTLRNGRITLERFIAEAADKQPSGIEVRHPSFDSGALVDAINKCDLRAVTRQLLARLKEMEPVGGVQPAVTANELRQAIEKVKRLHEHAAELDGAIKKFTTALGGDPRVMTAARQELRDFMGQRLGMQNAEIDPILQGIEQRAGEFATKTDAVVALRGQLIGQLLGGSVGEADFQTANRAVTTARSEYLSEVRQIARTLGGKLQEATGIQLPPIARPEHCEAPDEVMARR